MSFKIIFAVLLIFVGILMVFDKLSILVLTQSLINYWPILIITYGLSKFRRSNYYESSILIFSGFLLLLSTLGFISIKWHQLVIPIILIILGIRLLGKNLFNKELANLKTSSINSFNIFSGFDTKVTNKNFQGGSVTTIFGGAEIDLSEADSSSSVITIDLTTVFGGIDLTVPQNWDVNITGFPLFGSIDNKCNSKECSKLILKINAFALFGGIEINSK